MDTTLRSKLLTYLSGAAIAISTSSVDQISSTLGMIPEPIMSEFLDDVGADGWRTKDLLRLVRLLMDAPSARIRCRAASLLALAGPDLNKNSVTPILSQLAQDPDPSVRDTLARVIAKQISEMNELDRIQIVLDWALSPDASLRRHAVCVLFYGVPTFGDDMALDYLSNDESADVRTAVVAAAEKRLMGDPSWYIEILHRLSTDQSPLVSRMAKKAEEHFVDLV